ncbi:MAG: DUF5011 domain-containing protein, partial [Akkermansiaceae bacterium]|nr:DUF5011 domain-containing protein [Akkermansiaceae bacterium]
GDSGQALSHLTGQKASYGFIDSDPGNEWTADKLRALLDQDLPLIFSTGAPCALASSYGVKRRHAYSYESYDPQTQKFYLRNSWGFEHAYVTFEGLQIMGSNIAYLDGTKTKMERIDANSTFSAAFGAYGDEEESEAGLTAVESFGAVTLYKDADNRLYAGSVAQGIKPVRINGQLATLSLNERTAIAAESIGGINQILWRDNYSQALIKMNFDSSWQFLPTENVLMAEGTDEFNAAQLAFGEGGNADITAPVITVTSGTDTVEKGSTWTDAGATADGGETVTASGTVDTSAAGTYTITYTATDAAGNVGVVTRTVTVVETAAPVVIETQPLNLKAGWNLVSFYVAADDMTPATIFASIQNKLLQVKNLTQSYDPSVPSFLNTLSSLSVKDGYWLKVSEDVSLSVEGPVPSGASINVKSGWNLVGYPRLSGEAVANELTSLGNTVVQIKDLGSSYDPSVPSFLNTLSTMAPGSGYWLNVDADGTWDVGTVVEVNELNFAAVRTRSNHSSEERAGPSWGEATVYPNIGATVLAKVTIQGKPVAKGGVVAAFVGNELRGLQDVVLSDGMSYVTLNINLNEAEEVSYRVWNSDDDNEYLISGTMQLELGEMYGNPELVELNAVEVVNKPLEVFNVISEPFGFSFNTMAGRNYTVEATGDLRTWEAVELFQGSGGEIRFTAKQTSSGKSQFFRVLVE